MLLTLLQSGYYADSGSQGIHYSAAMIGMYILIIVIGIAGYAVQARLQSVFRKYSKVQFPGGLTGAEVAEVAELTRTAMRVVRAVSNPAGFNLGMNQGEVAGAGISHHLHQHVVPRWMGDANFLPVVGQTRALPQLLSDTWSRLREAWPS